MRDLAERVAEVKKRRALVAGWSTLTTVGAAQLLFASFAFGASFGPGPLKPIELLFGLVLSFGIGSAIAIPAAKRRVEKDARWAVRLHEGRRDRRIVVFDDYFTIDSEVVLVEAISQMEIDQQGLLLRYRDPSYEGAVLRELAGDRAVLERLVAQLTSVDDGSPGRGAPRG